MAVTGPTLPSFLRSRVTVMSFALLKLPDFPPLKVRFRCERLRVFPESRCLPC